MESKGMVKAIDELGKVIVAKDIELEIQRKEIEKMQKKIDAIQQYIEMYDECLSYDEFVNRNKEVNKYGN